MNHCSTISEGSYKEKGSKFLAFLLPCSSEDEAKEIRKSYQDQFSDARHICYAMKFIANDQITLRYSDDGEPNGTAGRPIAGQLEKHDLINQILLVVRYFGGTKLGTGGLVQAYKTAAANAIENADISTWIEMVSFDATVGYDSSDKLVNCIFDWQGQIHKKDFGEACTFKFSIPKTRETEMRALLNLIAL